MIFNFKKHNSILYNTLLQLSRNIFFYKSIELEDSYETRIYLMFFHYSIMLFVSKNKESKIDQDNYNNLFFSIEHNLRELGFGDVSVNKKMKDLNKIFYDILLKLTEERSVFKVNKSLIAKYFEKIKNNKEKRDKLELYFNNFHNFCFELTADNMIKEVQKFKY